MRGTIKEFIQQGLTVNGFAPSQVEWGLILKMAEKSGTANKDGEIRHDSNKGKPATIWKITGNFEVAFNKP